MNVIVNGDNHDVANGATVLSLLEQLGLNCKVTVVERNGDILDRASYGRTELNEGDKLELVHIVGGG